MSKIELIPPSSAMGGYMMRFLNGVELPLPVTGGGFHIIPTGCGTGKTTMIVEIARHFFAEGILIVTATTEAADELYERLCRVMSGTAICLLHSQPTAEKFMIEHRENPSALAHYPVVITTAVRIQHYPAELFTHFKLRYRGYVLIDECITFFPENPVQLAKIVPAISFTSSTAKSKKGRQIGKVKIDKKTFYQYTYDDPALMVASIMLDPQLKPMVRNPLLQARMEHIFRHIISYGPKLPRFSVGEIATKSTTLMFDGTADIMFKDDPRLLTPVTESPKYSSDIHFEQFHLPFRRHNGAEWDVEQLKARGNGLFQMIADLTQTEKVVIVTWKDIDKQLIKRDTDGLEAETFNFPDIISEILVETGAVRDNFGVIYRGSGLERGTNDFRDFSTLVLLGEWYIKDNLTSDLNHAFGTSCKFNDYFLALMIQTVCRLRIRQHKGFPIKVLYSDDIDYNLMWSVQNYFRQNSAPGCKISGIVEPIRKADRHEKNYLVEVALLGNGYPQIIDAFVNRTTLTLDIPKQDLNTLLPKDRPTKERYGSLLKFLKSRGIVLNII